MSNWPSTKSKKVLAALLKTGWVVSGKVVLIGLYKDGMPDYVFAFHDRDEIGPQMLARISKHTGLRP